MIIFILSDRSTHYLRVSKVTNYDFQYGPCSTSTGPFMRRLDFTPPSRFTKYFGILLNSRKQLSTLKMSTESTSMLLNFVRSTMQF